MPQQLAESQCARERDGVSHTSTSQETITLSDARQFRAALARYPSGVVAVCALTSGRPQGLAASSFTSVSLDPPLVMFCVAHTSSTWPIIRRAASIGVSVLGEDHAALGRKLAGDRHERFQGVQWDSSPQGAVVVTGAALSLCCTLLTEIPAGDHDIVLLRVNSATANKDVAPLVFHGSTFTRLAGHEQVADTVRRQRETSSP